ncbi:aaa-family atpase [Holotrichia oblita]|uniref:Aaa-family atpase n=1 Tax=Holotrichia oblita TaxID=644536 RepID=A0ACB9TYH7_HOLOL|nr:aaa-family atpase [Holotrichia oblita]
MSILICLKMYQNAYQRILLYGPPGTGKTLLAKAVATECGLCFLSVKGPELLNMYVGQSEQNIREVFDRAREASPCIIFFDELDSLAPNRGISGDSGGVMDRVVSQLLAEMDGLNKEATIFIIGATNRPDLIDPALLRPGRFDKLLYVGPAETPEAKLSVLKALTRKFKLASDTNLEFIVKNCPKNISGADFYGLCSNAWLSATRTLIRKIETGEINKSDVSHEDVVVSNEDFMDSLKRIKPSISPEDMRYFNKLKQELSTTAR